LIDFDKNIFQYLSCKFLCLLYVCLSLTHTHTHTQDNTLAFLSDTFIDCFTQGTTSLW